MLFTDPLFIFYFLPAVLVLHWFCNKTSVGQRYGNLSRVFLFASTVVFYGYNNTWWLIPFFVSIAFDFVWAWGLSRSQSPLLRKCFLLASVVQNLSLLGLFKYWNFFRQSIDFIAPSWVQAYLPVILENGSPLPLPAGISFYTFESLSFVIDVYRREIAPPKNPLEFFAFIAMFPRFIAGPIVRYKDMVSQFSNYRGMQLEAGLLLFAWGFFLKTAFADSFAAFVPYAFEQRSLTFASAWVGVFAYTMQIYFDFSGYSLMAIGIGRCLGFSFPDNFKQPYLACSLRDFWRRWHISLSSWLRDYLYIPLGGNQSSPLRTYLNLLVTMGLGGLWHGASINFVIWGLWHGIFLAMERQFRWEEKLSRQTGSLITLLIVMLGWVFFRAKTCADAFLIVRVMLNPFSSWAVSFEPLTIWPLSAAFCGAGIFYCFVGERKEFSWSILPRTMTVRGKLATAGMFLLSLVYAFSAWKIPFLYFQF